MPVEEHLLLTLKHAKLYLDQGFTSCFSAAATKPRLDIVTRNAIDSGQFPGPRLRAASVQFTVTGGVGRPAPAASSIPGEMMYTLPCDGPVEFRRAAREACREGVDVLKIVPSGDTSTPAVPSGQTLMADDEVAAVCEVAQRARQARRRACAQRRVGEDVRAPRRRRRLSRDVRRRRGARCARGGEGPRVRRARAVGHVDAPARGRATTACRRATRSARASSATSTRRSSACATSSRAACACCRAATTASCGIRTAAMRATSRTSPTSSASRRWRRSSRTPRGAAS